MTEESTETKPPFFSVVIPVYNKEPHIARSINSVLNQTFQDLELIIICDPSTDNSNAEVAKFTDPRIRVFHRDEPGPGGYAARNLGIGKAKAEWVAFLDADDEWYPEHLAQLKGLCTEFPKAAVLGCGCEISNPEKANANEYDAYYKKNYGRGHHYLNFEDYLSAEVSGMRPLNGITACIKKYILLNADGFPAGKANRGGDVDTWLRCIEKAGGVAWSPHIGAIYYRDSVNMVTRTQIFLAEVERETVANLLKKYDGKTAQLLKKFANRRTISAWRQNKHIKDKKNFILLDKLYINVEKRKSLFWIIVSLIPSFVFDLMLKIKPGIKKNVIPWLKKTPLAEFTRLGRALVYRFFCKPAFKGKKVKSDLHQLSDGDKPTFFGYHDKTPFSLDGTKVLAMSIEARDKKPDSECTAMRLGYFTKSDDGFNDSFKSFAETTTWCWQQGCMLQWYPSNQNNWVVYNDLVDGRYGSKVCDVNDGNKVKSYAHPVYSLDPNGRWASTLNFARLGRLRPGYGYSLLPDETKGQLAPEDDGLFVFSLETGDKNLLVKLSELSKDAGTPAAEHYVNHATFSPDGKRLVFFHLWATEGDKGRGLRVCEVDVNTGQWREVESERTVSHYCWKDANTFLATSREQSGKWHYTLYDLESNTRKDQDLPFNEDGHPMFHPTDKNLIVTDTYPDKRRDQHLCIVDLTTKEVREIATLYSPFVYRGQVRCDLHPRWDREGKYVVVDAVDQKRVLTCVDA